MVKPRHLVVDTVIRVLHPADQVDRLSIIRSRRRRGGTVCCDPFMSRLA